MNQITDYSSNPPSCPNRPVMGLIRAFVWSLFLISGTSNLHAESETVFQESSLLSSLERDWNAETPLAQGELGHLMGVSGTENETLFLTADGTLRAVHYGSYYLAPPVVESDTVLSYDVVSFAANGYTESSSNEQVIYFVTTDGRLWGKGDNDYGKIHFDSAHFVSFENPVVIDQDVLRVETDGFSVVYLKKDGSLWGQGYNSRSQMGVSSVSEGLSVRKRIIAKDVIDFGLNGFTLLFVKRDHSLWALGNLNDYDLGEFRYDDPRGPGETHIPQKMADGVKSIIHSTGATDTSGFITMDDVLWVMGYNGGRCGPAYQKNAIFRKPVPVLEGVQNAILSGQLFAQRTDGSLVRGTDSTFTQIASSCSGLHYIIDDVVVQHRGIAMYRFLNLQTNTHFFAANKPEYDGILWSSGVSRRNSFEERKEESTQWLWESVPFFVACESDAGSQPVYRMYNKASGAHFYTMSVEERDHLLATRGDTFQLEGVAFNAFGHQADGTLPVYRFYAPQTQSHFFTISEAEKDWIVANVSANDLVLDGIAWYCWPW